MKSCINAFVAALTIAVSLSPCSAAEPSRVSSVAKAKTAPSGTSLVLKDVIVTAGTDQMRSSAFFYVQDSGGGIRVRSTTAVHQGDKVTVTGKVRRASDDGTVVRRNGEREINATSVAFTYGPFTMPKPKALTNRQVGGGPTPQSDTDGFPCQPGVWTSSNGSNQGYDQINEKGASNVGLYCQVKGKVVYADDAARFFYIDDGSGVRDGAYVNGKPAPPGIRVLVPNGQPLKDIVGKSAVVVGVVGSVAQSDAGVSDRIRNIRVVRATCEPFLDLNLNGFWDPGERCFDTNGSGACDGIRIADVPAPKVVSKFDRYGTLILHGAPFMPKSLYCYDVDDNTLKSAKEQGFSAVQCFDSMTPADLPRLSAAGLKTFPTLHSEASRAAWMAARADPAIAAWYLNDEPEWHGEKPDTNIISYKWVYEQDGTHPVGNSHADIGWLGKYAASEDMCWIDRYPVGNAGGQWCIPTIADFDDTARAGHGGSPYYPVWQYVQMFKESPNFTVPTVPEFRAMVYTAMSHWVKGYFYFCYQRGGADWQALWAEAKKINGEMDTLRPFLTLPWVPLDAASSDPTWVKAGGYRIGNSALLIVANGDKDGAAAAGDGSRSVTITLPGIPDNAALTAPIGGDGVKLDGRKFTCKLAPCEVRVLLWGKMPAAP